MLPALAKLDAILFPRTILQRSFAGTATKLTEEYDGCARRVIVLLTNHNYYKILKSDWVSTALILCALK